ncbi:MAG: polysaccharide biosynthesis tyrosine autokinase [Pirellulales bacterium]|nr:polysaccharide biosynthesis tyrosine autokinase [Pirellulales bacterium]
MTYDPPAANYVVEESEPPHVLHSLVRFGRVVRYRKGMLTAFVIAGLLLGGLYFATATRLYESGASLLVMQTGREVEGAAMRSQADSSHSLMPTFQKLFSSDVVLNRVAERLPPEHRVDIKSYPREQWAEQLRERLTASMVRNTNIIDVVFRSMDAETASVVVNGVLESYLDFMDKNHESTAAQIVDVLTREKVQVERDLAEGERQLLAAQAEVGDVGLRNESRIHHPAIKEVVTLKESYVEARSQRLKLAVALAAIEDAQRRGVDPSQHLMALEGQAGDAAMLQGLGLGHENSQARVDLQKMIVEDRATLATLQQHFGPNHPKVTEINNRIAIAQQQLAALAMPSSERLTPQARQKLAGSLIQVLRRRHDTARQFEESVRQKYEQAQRAAVSLNGRQTKLEILESDVKWRRGLRSALLQRIASIDLQQLHGDIRTSVVSEPQVVHDPVWPRLPIVLVLSLFAGAAVGLMAIYAVDVLDDRFRGPEDMQAQLNLPVLAMVRPMSTVDESGIGALQVHAEPNDVASEAFRTLRTALAFGQHDAARLVVSSAEPGDGKTTIIANLAVAFAQAGKRTLLIDADLRRPGLTRLMQMKGHTGLADALVSDEPIAPAAKRQVIASEIDGLDLMFAGTRPSNPSELVASTRFAELLNWAESVYDQILIDSPPALATVDASLIGRLVDGAILVVQPAKNQRKVVLRAVESFDTVGTQLLGTVINQTSEEHAVEDYGYGYGYAYDYHADDDSIETPQIADGPIIPRRAA